MYRAQDEVVGLTFKSASTLGELRKNKLGQEWRLLIVQVGDTCTDNQAVIVYGNESLRMMRDALNGLDLDAEKQE